MTAGSRESAQFLRLFDRGGLIKICGLREPDHAVAAAEAGADFIGFIFAPARRQVTAMTARSCIEAARLVAPGRDLVAVGVFVDASLSDIEGVVEEAGIDAVQLHGAEPPEFIQFLCVPAFKALRPRATSTAGDVLSEIQRYRSSAVAPVGFLLDGYSESAVGGTGARADWGLAADVTSQYRVMLAGGLEPLNVGTAIHQVRPWGVDVSSGVEIGGVKDESLIRQFVGSAREAFSA